MAEFELEHWKSRATVAERERDSARNVLATLRHYFHRVHGVNPGTLESVREALRFHDRTWWTQDHAINSVAEYIAGMLDDGEEEQPR